MERTGIKNWKIFSKWSKIIVLLYQNIEKLSELNKSIKMTLSFIAKMFIKKASCCIQIKWALNLMLTMSYRVENLFHFRHSIAIWEETLQDHCKFKRTWCVSEWAERESQRETRNDRSLKFSIIKMQVIHSLYLPNNKWRL